MLQSYLLVILAVLVVALIVLRRSHPSYVARSLEELARLSDEHAMQIAARLDPKNPSNDPTYLPYN